MIWRIDIDLLVIMMITSIRIRLCHVTLRKASTASSDFRAGWPKDKSLLLANLQEAFSFMLIDLPSRIQAISSRDPTIHSLFSSHVVP